MKKTYEEAKLMLLYLAVDDILTSSDENWGEIETDENELPII